MTSEEFEALLKEADLEMEEIRKDIKQAFAAKRPAPEVRARIEALENKLLRAHKIWTNSLPN